MDIIGVGGRKKSCAAKLLEERRHVVSNIARAVDLKIAVKDSRICNIMTMGKKLKTVSANHMTT